MTERPQFKDLEINPIKMAILETGWMNALERRDSQEFLKYISEGLTHQYHLSRSSAEKAADYLLISLGKEETQEGQANIIRYHELLSQESGLGFDPFEASKKYLELFKKGKMDVDYDDVYKYHSILYGELGELASDNLRLSTRMRVGSINKYQMIRNGKNTAEANKAFGRLFGELVESYTVLNKALTGLI